MHDPFIPQRYYQINVFSSGQYRISCACLLQGYGCIYLACYLFAPAQLQINATKLVDRRTYRSYIDSQWLGWWKIKSFCWASFTDRLWYRREIHKQIKINMEWTKHFLEADSKILNVVCRYPQEHFHKDFEAIKGFVVVSYVSKSSKTTDLAETSWYVFSKMKKASQKKSKKWKTEKRQHGQSSSNRRDISSTLLAFSIYSLSFIIVIYTFMWSFFSRF